MPSLHQSQLRKLWRKVRETIWSWPPPTLNALGIYAAIAAMVLGLAMLVLQVVEAPFRLRGDAVNQALLRQHAAQSLDPYRNGRRNAAELLPEIHNLDISTEELDFSYLYISEYRPVTDPSSGDVARFIARNSTFNYLDVRELSIRNATIPGTVFTYSDFEDSFITISHSDDVEIRDSVLSGANLVFEDAVNLRLVGSYGIGMQISLPAGSTVELIGSRLPDLTVLVSARRQHALESSDLISTADFYVLRSDVRGLLSVSVTGSPTGYMGLAGDWGVLTGRAEQSCFSQRIPNLQNADGRICDRRGVSSNFGETQEILEVCEWRRSIRPLFRLEAHCRSIEGNRVAGRCSGFVPRKSGWRRACPTSNSYPPVIRGQGTPIDFARRREERESFALRTLSIFPDEQDRLLPNHCHSPSPEAIELSSPQCPR